MVICGDWLSLLVAVISIVFIVLPLACKDCIALCTLLFEYDSLLYFLYCLFLITVFFSPSCKVTLGL